MIEIPVLRAGKPYYSLKRLPLTDVRTGESLGNLSLALPGQIARDLRAAADNRRALERFTAAELVTMTKEAARLFAEAELPIGESTQGPEDYLECLAATCGMPLAMGRRNLDKIVDVMSRIDDVIDGLTRGLDLSVLDGGWGTQSGRRLSYLRLSDTLGAVLPNNSPGVHNLWVPSIALKTPLVLKPGSAEPWTPYRIAAAFMAVGCPPEAFSLYPTDHSGVAEVLLRTGRSLFFGDASTVKGWQGTGKVQLHGPGWSKVIFGPDSVARWNDHLDLMAESVAANGGRSCINASGVWAPSEGRAIAEALAEKLATIEARPLDHPEAALAAFPNPDMARRISEMIDQHLAAGGAVDLTAEARKRNGGPEERVAEAGGCTFLLPTVIHCEQADHPLATCEFTFPFVTVVESPSEQLLEDIGPTLIGSVISEDDSFVDAALQTSLIDRLNLGPIPTYKISWDQPHEGNLFDHLYHQRAFQTVQVAS